MSNVEEKFEGYSVVEDIDEIHHHYLRAEIRAEFDLDDKIRTYFAGSGTAPYKKKQIEHIIQESVYHLKIKIVGDKRLGLYNFIQLKQTVSQMKVTQSLKIKAWCQRFNTF